MAINFDSFLGVSAQALKVRAARTELLAGNLANVDTPNYKARDIDFRTVLKQASASQNSATTMDITSPLDISNRGSSAVNHAIADPLYRIPQQLSIDGNSVDEQVEQMQFMQNSIQYQASLSFLGDKFHSLTRAFKGE